MKNSLDEIKKIYKKLEPKGKHFIELGINFVNDKEGQIFVKSPYSAYDTLFIVIEAIPILVKLAQEQGTSQEALEKKMEQLKKSFVNFKGIMKN